MKQRTLQEVITVPAETDYLEHFQALATVNLEIHHHGPSAHRLLRKSILEADIGNYTAALEAARDAIDVAPTLTEAHYQEGMCLMLLAFSRAGVLAGAPGLESPIARPRRLLEQARDAFAATVAGNPADDEAAMDLYAIEGFLRRHEADDSLEAELRALFE